jgi:hypothetical protein
MHAVGADDEVGGKCATVFESYGSGFGILGVFGLVWLFYGGFGEVCGGGFAVLHLLHQYNPHTHQSFPIPPSFHSPLFHKPHKNKNFYLHTPPPPLYSSLSPGSHLPPPRSPTSSTRHANQPDGYNRT